MGNGAPSQAACGEDCVHCQNMLDKGKVGGIVGEVIVENDAKENRDRPYEQDFGKTFSHERSQFL